MGKIKKTLRNLLIGGILTATALTGAGCKDNSENIQTKPETKLVSTEPKTILHLKQVHLPLDGDCSSAEFNKIKENQEEIYKILDGLVKKGTKEICYEGTFKENTDLMNNSFELDKLTNSLCGEQYNPNIVFEGSLSNEELIKMGYRDAVNRLGAEGKIKVRATEDKEKFNNAINSVLNSLEEIFENPHKLDKIKNDLNNAVKEEREDAILKILSQYKDSVLPLVYGKGHDFKNNIKKWNSENPNKKYSLIEITPESYKEKN